MTDSGESVRHWRRSSRCDANDCVDVAFSTDGRSVLVRDSAHPEALWLTVSHDSWRELLRSAQRGDLDRP